MLLLIPGPVTTRPEVREALRHDFAPWDNDFRPLYAGIRERVLRIAHGIPGEHATLPLQGCGHFITEAAIRTFVPPGRKLLIPATGSYADRMIRLAREAGRIPVPLPLSPDRGDRPRGRRRRAEADPDISHVGLVHSETGSGIVHDVAAVGPGAQAWPAADGRCGVGVRRAAARSVGAAGDRAVGFTSNKCLEGVPGMAFAIARIDRVEACAGNAGSWSFDLSSIYAHALRSGWGSFRFTPPAQVLNAFNVALDLYRCRGRAAGAAGALHREYAHTV